MRSLVTSKNVSWPRLIWATLYIVMQRTDEEFINPFVLLSPEYVYQLPA